MRCFSLDFSAVQLRAELLRMEKASGRTQWKEQRKCSIMKQFTADKAGTQIWEENNMKKQILALIMAAGAAVSLAACSGSSTASSAAASSEAASSQAASSEAASSEAASEAESKAEESQAAGGTLTMATNAEFEPWEYHDGDKIIGIDADIAAALAKKLGMELKIEDMAFDAIIPSVSSGKADFGMAAISVTDERKASVDFTNTYADSALVVLVKNDNTEITGADALSGHKIGAQTGTTGELKATDLAGDENVERYNTYFEAIQSLKQGKIDAVVIDKAPAKVFLSQNDDIKQVGEEMDKEEYAIAVEKGNTELVDKLNTAIEELKADGTLDEIVNKYIPAE